MFNYLFRIYFSVQRQIIYFLLIAFLVFSVSCQNVLKRSEKSGQVSASKPAEGEQSIETTQPENTDDTVELTPKVGLILGPGGIKSLAHSGVIQQLEDAKIPIHGIVGIEWGALVAALYAQQGQVHEVEWKLFKLKPEDLFSKAFFSGKEKASYKKLGSFLQKSLSKNRFHELAIKMACPSLSLRSGTLVWQDSGKIKNALLRCMPYPPMFKTDKAWVASVFNITAAKEYLKNKGSNFFIYVNVLGEGELFTQKDIKANPDAVILWSEFKHSQDLQKNSVDLWVDVETRQFFMDNFKNHQALIRAGRQAGEKAADTLVEKYRF